MILYFALFVTDPGIAGFGTIVISKENKPEFDREQFIENINVATCVDRDIDFALIDEISKMYITSVRPIDCIDGKNQLSYYIYNMRDWDPNITKLLTSEDKATCLMGHALLISLIIDNKSYEEKK